MALAQLRFDKAHAAPIAEVPKEPVKSETIHMLNWDAEPKTVDELIAAHNLDMKTAGRWGGTTLFLVDARNRSGKAENIVEGQEFKLFLVPCPIFQTLSC